jgi:hypothetical protein
MNEENLFAQAFNDEPVTDAQASEQQDQSNHEQVPDAESVESADVAGYEQSTETPAESKHWIDSLSPEARAELDPILHDYKSNHGRIQGLTRKAQEQEERIKELMAQLEAKAAQPAPTEAPSNKPDDDPVNNLKEMFPELGNALEVALKRERERLEAEFTQRLTPLEQQRQQMMQREAALQTQGRLQEVAQVHPDWQAVVTSPVFSQWVDNQPDAVKQILADSQSPRDNIWLLSQFKRDMAIVQQAQRQQSNQKVDRLAQAAGVRQTGRVAQRNDDQDALFSLAFNQS